MDEFFIECKYSGAGFDFTGSLVNAIEVAREKIRYHYGVNCIWHGTQKIAEVREFDEWVSEAWKHQVS